MDWIITGASRGIGRALVTALGQRAGDRLFVLARDGAALTSLAAALPGVDVVPQPVDLTNLPAARAAGASLAAHVRPGATLVHNAGVWPTRRALVAGLEAAFVLNCLAPLHLQAPLVAADRLARVLFVSAGLLVKGRCDAARTPTGRDFSMIRTYCTTKLAGAVAARDFARAHPTIDVAVLHPGVVDTDLGAMRGPLGWLMRRVKRGWERPERCAERMLRVLAVPRWQAQPGLAPWIFEEAMAPWPPEVDRAEAAVRDALARLQAPGLSPAAT